VPDRQGAEQLAARHVQLARWPAGPPPRGERFLGRDLLGAPPGDCFEKDFSINLNYADGQGANVNAKSTEHSDDAKKYDPEAPSGLLPNARVSLVGDEQLFGRLEGLDEEVLHLRTSWNDRLDVPLALVAGIHVASADRKEPADSFERRLRSRGAEDLLLARTRDGEVVALSGIVGGTDGDKLRFRYRDQDRTLPLRVVEGLVLAARPAPERAEGSWATFSLPGGLSLTGRWKAIEGTTWKVETPWGQAVGVPAGEVEAVRFRGGKMVYLSDLEPSRVEETPFFGRGFPWRRDVNLQGGPIKIDGEMYERGVAVHSRCMLSYDLDGRYSTFRALVGFDDAARRKGRVDCRVFADDREVFANPDLRADAPPVPLDLPVAGVKQLRLLIGYGPAQDTGDRVVWANARLYQRPPPAAPTTTASR
jgi:hypothetical protein